MRIWNRGSRIRTTLDGKSGRAATWVALLMCLVLLGKPSLAAQEVVEPRLPQIVVDAPPELTGLAIEVRALGQRLRRPMELTGLADPGPAIRVFLAPESSELARAQPAWVSGFADPPASVVVLIHGRLGRYPDRDLESLLQHEVTHVLTYRAAGRRRVPRWFDEGLAMAASRESDLGDRAHLALAMLRNDAWSLAQVERTFGNRHASPTSAYALSQDFVRHLMQRYGSDVGARILAGVARGESFPIAFRVATGEPLDEIETAWARRSWWDRWIPVIGSSTLVWIGISLLALLAFVRRSQRDAEIREAWSAQEATGGQPITARAVLENEVEQVDEPMPDETGHDEPGRDSDGRLIN